MQHCDGKFINSVHFPTEKESTDSYKLSKRNFNFYNIDVKTMFKNWCCSTAKNACKYRNVANMLTI